VSFRLFQGKKWFGVFSETILQTTFQKRFEQANNSQVLCAASMPYNWNLGASFRGEVHLSTRKDVKNLGRNRFNRYWVVIAKRQ